jgi:hypothetical protein
MAVRPQCAAAQGLRSTLGPPDISGLYQSFKNVRVLAGALKILDQQRSLFAAFRRRANEGRQPQGRSLAYVSADWPISDDGTRTRENRIGSGQGIDVHPLRRCRSRPNPPHLLEPRAPNAPQWGLTAI